MTQFEYKCRRCGAVFADTFCKEEDPKKVVEAHTQDMHVSVAYHVHKCEDGGVGVADWIGCSKSE